MNYAIIISYDGRNFCGFQLQPNGRTVAEVIRKAVSTVFGEYTSLSGCSRTDSGVHALEYCLSFSAEKELSPEAVVKALNANLPEDVSVLSCRYVQSDFHARYSVKSKEYVYRIYNSRVRSPFEVGRSFFYPYDCDVDAMDRAARFFEGTHDFAAFMASGSKITDTERTVFSARVRREGSTVLFSVSADGFLYNMVRIMMGTLLLVGKGDVAPEDIPLIIEGKDRSRAGATVPPDGLYLNKVNY